MKATLRNNKQRQRMVSTQEETTCSSYPLKPTSSNLYNQLQPKVRQSDILVKHDIPHSHDLSLGHSDNHTTPIDSIPPSMSTVTTTSNVLIKDPMYSSLPFMGETHYQKSSHYSPSDLYDEVVHHVSPSNPYKVWPPPTKDSRTMELPLISTSR